MTHPLQLLRTEVRDQREPGWTRRGSRYWTQVEVSADMIFIVEGRYRDGDHVKKPVRFITAALAEALEIPTQYGLHQVELLACAWKADGSCLFGKVKEAYGESLDGPIFVMLESGDAFLSSCADISRCVISGRRVFPLPQTDPTPAVEI